MPNQQPPPLILTDQVIVIAHGDGALLPPVRGPEDSSLGSLIRTNPRHDRSPELAAAGKLPDANMQVSRR
jgi:hypothetical protein